MSSSQSTRCASSPRSLHSHTDAEAFTLPTKPVIMVFVGRQESGKSYAIKSLMNQWAKIDHFSYGVVFTGTKFTGAYKYLPEKCVQEWKGNPSLQGYIEKLRKWQEKTGKPCPPNFVILDDLLGSINWYDPWMTNWIGNFRHTNTTVIVAAQYLAQGSSTTFRECTNYAFMFNSSNEDSMKFMSKFFGGMKLAVPGKDRQIEFERLLQRVTEAEQYQALLYRNNRKTVQETFLAWKADPVPDDLKIKLRGVKEE